MIIALAPKPDYKAVKTLFGKEVKSMQQEAMSLMEFQNRFGSEEDCQRHLFCIRWPRGYHCPRCNHDQAYFHGSRHWYQCKSCGYQSSLTAGTIFHKTRTPLRKWFWMIFLMGRHKSGISMLSLQRMLEIKNYRTAWIMGHKIRKAMADRDAHYKLAGLVEIDDAYFGAPNQQTNHEPVVVGCGQNAAKVLPWVHTLIANIKGNIRGVYHGVSSKHLKRYLPEFCYRFNRRFWESQMFDRLLTACVDTTTITFSELKA